MAGFGLFAVAGTAEAAEKGKTGWIRDDLLHTSADYTGTCIPEDLSWHS